MLWLVRKLMKLFFLFKNNNIAFYPLGVLRWRIYPGCSSYTVKFPRVWTPLEPFLSKYALLSIFIRTRILIITHDDFLYLQYILFQHICDEGIALIQQAQDAAICKVWHFSWSLLNACCEICCTYLGYTCSWDLKLCFNP